MTRAPPTSTVTSPNAPNPSRLARPNTAPAGHGTGPGSATGGNLRLLDLINSLYRHRYLIVSVFLLVVLGAAAMTFTTTPLYSARGQLLIEEERTATLSGLDDIIAADYLLDPEPYYQTQYRILTGHEFARRVMGKLDLGGSAEFGHDGPLDDGLVDAFAARITVAPIPQSRLVNVSFVSSEPEFAARAVNMVVNEYVAQNLELRQQTTQNSLDWLSTEIARQQQKVEDGEGAMAEYRERNDALSLEDRQNIVVSRLNQLNEAVTRAKTARVQRETVYQQVQGIEPTLSAESLPAVLQSAYIQSVKSRLADLQREKATLAQRYGDKYPDIIKVNASIADVAQQLEMEVARAVEGVRNDYRSAVAEERILTSALEDQKQAAMELNRKNVGYTVLQREAGSNRQLYETLLQRQKEMEVVSNSLANNVRVIERARVPAAPFSPNPFRALTLALFAGLALSIGLALGIDRLDDTIKTPEDVKRMRLPLLGVVPAVKKGQTPEVSRATIDQYGEAFRAFRTSMALSAGAQGTRVILVTSAQPLEGKTTTACNLARALAHGGARVLLIDADMRRPGVHANFGLENPRGLSDVLNGRVPVQQVVQRLAEPSLWVLTAGRPPANPSELLGSMRMNAMMTNARTGAFDWVIVDTPPVLAVTDALILTPWVTGVAVVVGSEMTSRSHVDRVMETLAPSAPRVLGIVLNRVDLVRNKYYYSRYYGPTYKAYVAEAA